jgi:hypothetical protein
MNLTIEISNAALVPMVILSERRLEGNTQTLFMAFANIKAIRGDGVGATSFSPFRLDARRGFIAPD